MPKVIGLTGPVGAGKTEVVKILRQQGAYIIDVDEVAHELYAPQSEAWHELVRIFGSKILMRGGRIHRHKLAEIVFFDRRKLRELNRIVHPYLKEAVLKKVSSLESRVAGQKPIVINAAVLKEIGLIAYVDEVWVVMAPKNLRLKRLLKRGLSKSEANARIKSQLTQRQYLKLADVVIYNNGTLKNLKADILRRHRLVA